ncbi:MAG: response regulator [Lachnospiraceae bacterium]
MANYHIIVAEDEDLLLHNLVQKIEQLELGFHVVGTAQTGIQAYSLVKELTPDLLITDIRMPVMDGLQLLQNVHDKFPLTKFIITSGFSDFSYAKTAISLRVSAYLLKPIDPAELKDALLAIRTELELEQKNYESIFADTVLRNAPDQIAMILHDFLIQNYTIDINLNLIAGSMNYSSSYLTKIFYQQYGTTPSKFITSLRIMKAKQYLTCHPEFSVCQIAEMTGYHDQGYFSRIFKKQTLLSPLEYREQHS